VSAIHSSGAGAAAAELYLTRADLCRRWRISRATSYRMQANGYLRPPVKLGPGITRWSLAEIEEIEARAAEDRAERADVRALAVREGM
jgi:predicted DNA-binding transcriptional regulator AlpA